MWETAANYIKDLHLQIQHEYKDASRTNLHRGLIALNIAELILKEHGRPQLYCVCGIETSKGSNETLYPALYQRRLTWGGHTVCGEGEELYDPLIGHPIHISQYVAKAFLNSKVEIEVCVPEDEIQSFIIRRRK